MLTNEDIQKIIEAQREVFATKEDLISLKEEIKEDFSNLRTSVDAYAKKADTYFHPVSSPIRKRISSRQGRLTTNGVQEMVMLSRKVERHLPR